MTIQQLSAESVKIQLSAEELKPVLTDAAGNPDSPQMLRLISLLLRRAESVCAIPFSAYPVTVEILAAPDGGMVVYLTAQIPAETRQQKKQKTGTQRMAAQFRDRDSLRSGCMQLLRYGSSIPESVLYRHGGCYVLSLRVRRRIAPGVRHVLTEFGMLFPLSAINRARLSEFGQILLSGHAVAEGAAGKF